MPITSKYSDEKVEQILTEIAAVLEKHSAGPELSLMIAGNIATNVLNQDVAPSQRKVIAEKFAQALVSSIEDKSH
ncbi:YejL family protein [Vibrio hepatarius]|uniref:YejL family protein n=1 Tax=Vibrio hepatarius TaxID=171383 RepID=UPI00142D6F05|nr:YejL family protein [Vibrio hepatarius]NIY82196.1 YejL family protein [Vibrio hepatarius]NVJ56835.1 YejL family protein [Vibrionaceae bacterium]